MNNYLKTVGMALPKKWSGQYLTGLTSDYGPENELFIMGDLFVAIHVAHQS